MSQPIIEIISFPNTAIGHEQSFYRVGRNCEKIEIISKNGEMALVNWFRIWKDGKPIAEIKESVCDISFL